MLHRVLHRIACQNFLDWRPTKDAGAVKSNQSALRFKKAGFVRDTSGASWNFEPDLIWRLELAGLPPENTGEIWRTFTPIAVSRRRALARGILDQAQLYTPRSFDNEAHSAEDGFRAPHSRPVYWAISRYPRLDTSDRPAPAVIATP